MKRDVIYSARLCCCEVVRETETLSGRLARESETQSLCLLIIFVDDEIVAGGLTREVAIDDARREQSLALRAFFQSIVSRADMLRDELAIVFDASLPLLELPLPFEERRLVDESEDIIKRNLIHYARAVKRRTRNRRVRINIGARRVR